MGEAMPEQDLNQNSKTAAWYVVHTYSGYENKVKDNLEKAAENNRMQHLIQEVQVPIEEVAEIKNGKRVITQHKTFPGYVLVKMIITSESWYVVRNTRGVTGFVGPSSKPVPLTEEEVAALGVETREAAIDYKVGENVEVTSGPLEGFIGVVEAIDMEAQKVKVKVSMFGRETAAELELVQVKPL